MTRLGITLALLAPLLLGSARAVAADAPESDDVRRAREEVEQEMRKMVQMPDGSVKVVWTGFDYRGYEIDEAHLDLDGRDVTPSPASQLVDHVDRTLYEGKLAAGTHHVHMMLLLHLSNLSLLGGYRVTQFRVGADIPFPSAQGLSVPVRFGLHIDPQADDPKKKMVVITDIKPVMLAKIDDSMLPEMPKPVTQVAAAEIVPPPPVVAAADAAPPPAEAPTALAEAEVDAGRGRAAPQRPVRERTPHAEGAGEGAAPRAAVRDAGPSEEVEDAGAPSADAGPVEVDAGPPVIDAGPPAPVVVAAPPPPPPPAAVADDSVVIKRVGAGVLGLIILVGVIVVLRRRAASPK